MMYLWCALATLLGTGWVSAEDLRLLDLPPEEAQQYIENKDQTLKYAPKIESNVPAVRVLGKTPTNVLEDIYLANQYHGQDGLGGYLYGYSVPDIAKTEKKKAHGELRGAYQYINDGGQEIKVQYWDDGTGFHQVDNLPEVLPKQVEDAPDVQAAKDEFFRRWHEEAVRNTQPNTIQGGTSDGTSQYNQQQHQPGYPSNSQDGSWHSQTQNTYQVGSGGHSDSATPHTSGQGQHLPQANQRQYHSGQSIKGEISKGGYQPGQNQLSSGGYQPGQSQSNLGGYVAGSDQLGSSGYQSGQSQSSPGGYRPEQNQLSSSGYQPGQSQSTLGGYVPDQLGSSGYQSGPSQSSSSGYQPQQNQLSSSGYQPGQNQLSSPGYQSEQSQSSLGGYVPAQLGSNGYQSGQSQPSSGGYQPEQNQLSSSGYQPGQSQSSLGPTEYQSEQSQSSSGNYQPEQNQLSFSGYKPGQNQFSPSGYQSGQSQSSLGGYVPGQLGSSGYQSGQSQSSSGGYQPEQNQLISSGYQPGQNGQLSSSGYQPAQSHLSSEPSEQQSGKGHPGHITEQSQSSDSSYLSSQTQTGQNCCALGGGHDYFGQSSSNRESYTSNESDNEWEYKKTDEEKGPPRGFFYNFDYPVGIIVQKENGVGGVQKRESLEALYTQNKANFDHQVKSGRNPDGSSQVSYHLQS